MGKGRNGRQTDRGEGNGTRSQAVARIADRTAKNYRNHMT